MRRWPSVSSFSCIGRGRGRSHQSSTPQQQLIIVLGPLRRIVQYQVIGQEVLKALGRHASGIVIVQAKDNAPDRIALQILSQGPGHLVMATAVRAIDAGQGEGVGCAPVLPALFQQGQVREGVNGAFKDTEGLPRPRPDGNSEGEPLIAPGHLAHEGGTRVCAPKGGIPGRVSIVAHEHAVVVGCVLIELVVSDAGAEYLGVDAAAGQVGHHPPVVGVAGRQTKRLGPAPLRGDKRRRGHVPCAEDLPHGVWQGQALHLHKIVQRGDASHAAGPPVPLPIGEFETAVGACGVGAVAVRNQLVRLIPPQIGQQVQLPGLGQLFRSDREHMVSQLLCHKMKQQDGLPGMGSRLIFVFHIGARQV